MKVLPIPFKEAVKKVKAAGRGGIEDEQRVIVRAEPGRLVFIGIGTEAQPGTEASCPLKYEGDPVAVITSLVGLRWIANTLAAADEVELTVCEQAGVRIVISSWKNHGRDAELKVCSESLLKPRTVFNKNVSIT